MFLYNYLLILLMIWCILTLVPITLFIIKSIKELIDDLKEYRRNKQNGRI